MIVTDLIREAEVFAYSVDAIISTRAAITRRDHSLCGVCNMDYPVINRSL
jgi:hypothetical protein